MRSRAAVIAMQHAADSASGPTTAIFLTSGIQRQHAVIFQQHDRFARRFQRERAVRRAIDFRIRRLGIGHHRRRIEHSQAKARGEQAFQ